MKKVLQCARCEVELASEDYIFNGEPVCAECYRELDSPDTIVQYVKAYPEPFFDYLRESCISDDGRVIAMLMDYREWMKDAIGWDIKDFGAWALS